MGSLVKYVTITFVVFVILSGLACSFYSFTQVQNHETKGNGTTSDVTVEFCKIGAVMHPTKFTFKVDDHHVILCNWATHNQGVRISYCLGGAIFAIVNLVLMFKSKKVIFMIMSIIIMAVGGCGVYSFIIDANAVYKSKKWCEKGMEGTYGLKNYDVECLYNPLIGTVLLNVFSSILMIISSILVLRYRKEFDHSHHHHHHHSGADGFYEESAPLVQN